MSLTTVMDKGTELGTLIQLITTLRYERRDLFIHISGSLFGYNRQKYQPYISEEQLPAVKTVKSVFNITRERNWRPLYEKDLANVLHFYQSGKVESGFLENDPIHLYVRCNSESLNSKSDRSTSIL
jgi:hypothetical protein